MRYYKYIIFTLLGAIFLSSCGYLISYDKVFLTWEIMNRTNKDIIVNLMEVPNRNLNNFHNIITRAKTARVFHLSSYDVTKRTDNLFNYYWKQLQMSIDRRDIDKTIKCEIYDLNGKLLKSWTMDELQDVLISKDEKHFFREEDWHRVEPEGTNSISWTFYLYDEDLE